MDVLIATIDRLTSWPVIILILAGWRFRSQVEGLLLELRAQLPRVRKAGPIGVELDAIEKQKDDAPNPAANTVSLTRMAEPPPSDAIMLLESGLIESLQSIPDTERVSRLVRQLAIARVQASHEFLYNRVFDSQLVALRRLNSATNVSMQNAREFLNVYCLERSISPDVLQFDPWFHFMLMNNLVSVNGDAIAITPFGRDFLVYIVGQRLPEVKGVL